MTGVSFQTKTLFIRDWKMSGMGVVKVFRSKMARHQMHLVRECWWIKTPSFFFWFWWRILFSVCSFFPFLLYFFSFFFFTFPEPIIFLFLSFSFIQGRVLLALDYLKGYYRNQSIISEMWKPSEDEIHGHF